MGLLNLQDKGGRLNTLRGLLSGYLTDAMEAASGAPDRVGLLAEALANPREIWRQLANFPPLKRPEGNQMDSELGNLAMNFGASPIAAAGTFIGKGAKTWNALRAAEAEAMEKAGHDPTAIWKQTGTWRGPDKHLRQEIDDSLAKLNLAHAGAGDAEMGIGKLGNFFKHNPLYAAYPDIADIQASVYRNKGIPESGSYSANGKDYHEYFPQLKAEGEFGVESPVLHELQHAIQEREGWSPGGSPGSVGLQDRVEKVTEWRKAGVDEDEITRRLMDLFENSGFEQYRHLAGEAEARATQARMNFSPEHRRAIPPFVSYDVPLEQLILRGQR